METQYKLAGRSAHLLSKDAPPDEAARVVAAVTKAKGQLSRVSVHFKKSNVALELKGLPTHLVEEYLTFSVLGFQVRERCPVLVRECHALLPLLDEMEEHISVFYQALERAGRITARDADTLSPTLHRHKWQVCTMTRLN